jgi:hypothetical protein
MTEMMEHIFSQTMKGKLQINEIKVLITSFSIFGWFKVLNFFKIFPFKGKDGKVSYRKYFKNTVRAWYSMPLSTIF